MENLSWLIESVVTDPIIMDMLVAKVKYTRDRDRSRNEAIEETISELFANPHIEAIFDDTFSAVHTNFCYRLR
jgi:hypothetical protein